MMPTTRLRPVRASTTGDSDPRDGTLRVAFGKQFQYGGRDCADEIHDGKRHHGARP